VAAAERELGIDLEERRVDVGEVELHVVLAGPEGGPPVVLLHGFPEFWYAWFRQMGALAAAGFRVIAPDQRGYGGSSKPRASLDYLDQGRLVELGTGTHWVLQEEPELTSRILIGFFAEALGQLRSVLRGSSCERPYPARSSAEATCVPDALSGVSRWARASRL